MIFNFLYYNFNFDSIESVDYYFNKNLPLLLITIYPICCLLVIAYKKNRSSFSFCATSIIWFIDLLLILLNYKQFMQMLSNSTLIGPLNRIDLGSSVYYLMPLIQTIILMKIISFAFNLLYQPFRKEKTKSILLNNIKQQIKANSSQTETNDINNNEITPIQFNYNLISPQAYTLMKYIQSRQIRLNDITKQNESVISGELIKPARFSPSELSLKKRTKNVRKNSIGDSDRLSNNSESDESDESSIISGMTNLYLNRNKANSNLSLFETNYLNSKKSNASKLNESLYQSSFYQEMPFNNRSLVSTSFNNKKNSKSLLNLFKE